MATERGYYADFAPQAREREANQYEHFLGIQLETLAQKTILNIGSGKTGQFEKTAAQHGATVLTMSPYFADDTGGAAMRHAYTTKNITETVKGAFGYRTAKDAMHPIAANAEDGLPIADASVDYALGLYSVPLYLKNDESLAKEINRVLKPDGTALFYPVAENKRDSFIAAFTPYRMEAHAVPINEDPTDEVHRGEQSYRISIKKRAE